MKKNRLKNSKESFFLIELFSTWGFTWQGLFNNNKGEWWLLLQIATLLCHLLPRWPYSFESTYNFIVFINLLGILLIIIGTFLAIKALLELGSSLSPLPEPKPNEPLIIKGSYMFCRHPLYQGLIIISIGITFFKSSFLHLLLFIILLFVLKLKARREEKSLMEIHPVYKSYMKNTPAFFSGVKFLDWRS
tara:strand:- start:4902 stop:5471 length:570 start_codon:yes stop_codon:yes gene_type:complete